MTTITKYVCDLCGQVFDNEIECQRHEILEKIGNHLNGVILFDGNKQVLSFDTVIASFYDEVWGIYIDEVWGIYIEDENAIPFIEEVFRFCEIISPWSIDGGNNRKTTGLYLYDVEHYRWYLPADKIEELKKEMKEYGVDA